MELIFIINFYNCLFSIGLTRSSFKPFSVGKKMQIFLHLLGYKEFIQEIISFCQKKFKPTSLSSRHSSSLFLSTDVMPKYAREIYARSFRVKNKNWKQNSFPGLKVSVLIKFQGINLTGYKIKTSKKNMIKKPILQ